MEANKSQVCDIPGKVISITRCLKCPSKATVTDVFVVTERTPPWSVLLSGCVHSIAKFLSAVEPHGKQHGADRGQGEGEGTQETGFLL